MAKNKKILLIVGAIVLLVVIAAICLFAFKKDKEKATYIVTFNSNGGSTISEQNIEDGTSVTKPEDPIKNGYIFIEWLLDGKSFDFNNIVDKDITLTAKWEKIVLEKEMVTIKFNSDGGTTISNQIIEKGNKVTKPVDPVKDGYSFAGWTLNGEAFDFEKVIEEDMELKATWEEVKNDEKTSTEKPNTDKPSNNNSGTTTPTTPTVKKYTVTFNSNGGSSVASQTVEEGKKATQPSNPTRSGHTFAGWTLNGSAYDFNSAVNGNITLVATWTENVKANYTVTFNSNGGSAISSQTVVEGNKVTKPANPTREGYNFTGWTLNGSSYNFDNAVNGNITLVANWKQKNYTITASRVDAYSPDSKLIVFEDGNAITVKAIKFSDGVQLCSGANTTVNTGDIAGETSFIIVLNGGTEVRATLQ